MGKKNRKRDDEKQEKLNVVNNEDKGLKLSKSLLRSDNAESIEYCCNEKETKTKEKVYNEAHKIPLTKKKHKNNEVIKLSKNKNFTENILLTQDNSSILNSEASKKAIKKKQDKAQEQEIINKIIKTALNKHNQILVRANEEDSTNDIQSKSDQISKSSKKNRKVNSIQNEIFNEDLKQHETPVIGISKKDKKKGKGALLSSNEDPAVHTSTDNDKNIKKRKHKQNLEKQIVQSEDQNEVINNDNNSKKTTKKKKRKIVEEEVINDEDIDKYCDELDAVHNKQYEDWVKLIEINLSSNKKVKK